MKISEIISDEGVSSFRGDNIKRGKFSQILEKIESGEITEGDYICIESIDRISRQILSKTATTLYSILEKGVYIYTTSDNRLYRAKDEEKDLENYLMIGLIAKRANEESATKSKRRKSAWLKAKREAEEGKTFHKNLPYGFKRDENDEVVIHEERAKEIRFIFENLKKEGVSATIKKVNEWSERKWTNRHIHLMFLSKYPTGALMSQRREGGKKVFEKYIENYFPKIVDEKDFSDAQNAMKKRGVRKEYGNQSKGFLNIFRHCIKCGKCGGTMIFLVNKNQKGQKFCYLNCVKRKEYKEGCGEQFIRYEYVLALFLERVRNVFEFQNRLIEEMKSVEYEVDSFESILRESEKTLLELVTEKEDNEQKAKLREKERELARAKSILENIEKSLDGLEGVFPKILIEKLQKSESEVERLEKEIDSVNQERKEKIGVASFLEFSILLYTEEGRRRINEALKSNDVVFEVEFEKRNKKVTFRDKTGEEDEAYFLKGSSDFDLLDELKLRNISKYV